MRWIILALTCATAAAACDLDFVAAPTSVAMDVSAMSEHGDSLFGHVSIIHETTAIPPVVLVAGDTAEWAEVDGGRILHHAMLRPDSMDPRVPVRVERPGSVLELDLPILVRRGPAHWNQEGMLVLPVHLIDSGFPWRSRSWRVRFRNRDGETLLSVDGRGLPPVPLVFPAALVPWGTVAIEVVTQLGWESSAAGVAIRGQAELPLTRDTPNTRSP